MTNPCLEGKYCYALEDLEGLFYKDFRNKNNDCYTLYHYHQNKGYIALQERLYISLLVEQQKN